jgi:hypothetical protein
VKKDTNHIDHLEYGRGSLPGEESMVLDHEELARKAEQLGLSTADLRSTIDDAAAEQARRTTQDGLAMQLRFLSRDYGWSESKIEERMKELARSKRTEEIGELASKARKLGLKPDDLDEIIHGVASNLAASINNQGLYEQIAYWAKEGYASVNEIEQEPRTIAEAKHTQTGSPRAAKGEDRA